MQARIGHLGTIHTTPEEAFNWNTKHNQSTKSMLASPKTGFSRLG